MGEGMSLQRGTEGDIDVCLELGRKVKSRTYIPFKDSEAVRDEMAKGSLYLIKKADRTAGFVSYQVEDGSAYLSELVVDPEFQGQGLGKETLRRFLSEVKDASKVWLVTHPDNTNAIKLYESFGFRITDRKENYFGDGEPRVVLTLDRGTK